MSHIAIDRALWSDCLEALQHMEDQTIDIPETIRSQRWTNARKRLVLAMWQSAERELAEEPPALLRRQA